MTKGMRSLVSFLWHYSTTLADLFQQLRNELWSLRSTFKRTARGILLIHYSELSPSNEVLLDWIQENSTAGMDENTMEASREELLVCFRKAKIAELTGVEGQKRKAKFIYDLNKLVSASCYSLCSAAIPADTISKVTGR